MFPNGAWELGVIESVFEVPIAPVGKGVFGEVNAAVTVLGSPDTDNENDGGILPDAIIALKSVYAV